MPAPITAPDADLEALALAALQAEYHAPSGMPLDQARADPWISRLLRLRVHLLRTGQAGTGQVHQRPQVIAPMPPALDAAQPPHTARPPAPARAQRRPQAPPLPSHQPELFDRKRAASGEQPERDE